MRQSRGLYGVSRPKRLVRSLLVHSLLMPTGAFVTGAFVAHANFPFGSCAYERLCPTFASLSGKSGDFHRLNHLCHSPAFKNRKPWHTPGNVKLLLPPRQSRGISHLVQEAVIVHLFERRDILPHSKQKQSGECSGATYKRQAERGNDAVANREPS